MKKIQIFILATALCLLFMFCTKDNCMTEAQTDCNCGDIYEPVCGCNGLTYPNECEAKCAGVRYFKRGDCVSNTITGY